MELQLRFDEIQPSDHVSMAVVANPEPQMFGTRGLHTYICEEGFDLGVASEILRTSRD